MTVTTTETPCAMAPKCIEPAAVTYTLKDADKPANDFTRNYCVHHANQSLASHTRPGRTITMDAIEQLDDSPIVVDMGAPSAFLDGAHQLAVCHQLGVNPRAAGAEGWIDVVTVDPIGDVLTLLTPEAARRLAAALYDAALRLEASGR